MMVTRRHALLLASALPVALVRCGQARASGIEFRNVEEQSRQFMRWHAEIRLTPEQERVKKAALESIPAPCCSDNSAYTCCCPCNISRTIWGLSQYMIARQGSGVSEVRKRVREWIAFIAPGGFSGSACYNRGCQRPFNQDGCGGMDPDNFLL